jgi:hypothetical protein
VNMAMNTWISYMGGTYRTAERLVPLLHGVRKHVILKNLPHFPPSMSNMSSTIPDTVLHTVINKGQGAILNIMQNIVIRFGNIKCFCKRHRKYKMFLKKTHR